jgi:hypothetical protein
MDQPYRRDELKDGRRREITIEGYLTPEWAAMADEVVDDAILTGEPIVFRTGTAEVLAQARVNASQLAVEVAHVDGGGEGVMLALRQVAKSIARRRGLAAVEWLVYAAHCAVPNPNLQAVLEKSGFKLVNIEGKGEVYWMVDRVGPA